MRVSACGDTPIIVFFFSLFIFKYDSDQKEETIL